MFIETHDTPNPDTLKFLPGREVAGERVVDFARGDDVSQAPLAEMLFMIPDVARVMMGGDYISVSKVPEAGWTHLKPAVLGAIMDFFVAGGVPLHDQIAASLDEEHSYEGETLEIVEQIKELIELRVKPAVAQDGGDIVFRHFRGGGRNGVPGNARRLCGLPILDHDAQARHREPAQALCAGSDLCRTGRCVGSGARPRA